MSPGRLLWRSEQAFSCLGTRACLWCSVCPGEFAGLPLSSTSSGTRGVPTGSRPPAGFLLQQRLGSQGSLKSGPHLTSSVVLWFQVHRKTQFQILPQSARPAPLTTPRPSPCPAPLTTRSVSRPTQCPAHLTVPQASPNRPRLPSDQMCPVDRGRRWARYWHGSITLLGAGPPGAWAVLASGLREGQRSEGAERSLALGLHVHQ